jgi:hypothetical protein
MKIVLLIVWTVCVTTFANEVHCTAKVTNRTYKVTLNTESREIEVITDNGHHYNGITSRYYSPRSRSEIYYLPATFTHGLEVELEMTGQHRIALCLTNTECYLCK